MIKKIHKLLFEPDYSFLLVGIVSSENDYRLCWLINRRCNLKFARINDLKITTDKQDIEALRFPLFCFNDEKNRILYHFIGNKCGNGFLMEEMRNIDFFIKIDDEDRDRDHQPFISLLKQTESVRAIFSLDAETLKSREKLLF